MDTQNSSRDFPGEYRLDVEDFGPIAKASVDLRPLTVFIGPSNTGKSYLAILLYAMHQIFGSGNPRLYGRRLRYLDQLLASIVKALRKPDGDASAMLYRLRDWIQYHFDEKSQDQMLLDLDSALESEGEYNVSTMQSRTSFPEDVDLYIRSELERTDVFAHDTEREIGRCFGIRKTSSLVRNSSKVSCATVELTIPRKDNAGFVRYEMRLHEDGIEFLAAIGGERSLSNDLDRIADLSSIAVYPAQYSLFHPREDVEYFEIDNLSFVLAGVVENVFTSLLRPLCRNAYYLPAGRTGLMGSNHVVASTLVQRATTAGLHSSPVVPSLSGVLADFLSQLIVVSGEPRPSRSDSSDDVEGTGEELARSLERNVLKGTVKMASMSRGYPSFDYHPHDWNEPLPLMRASSMVSELAPVVLYLRHLVEPDDVLIIEEPESHLHPGMQVEFTRQLAGLVRAGIRVIVTTHSEWVLQELANLVRASELSEGDRAGVAGGDVALEADQVGAWLFKPDATGEGSTVNEIPLDGESGLYPTDFEDVAVAMHNDWAEIFSRLGEAE